MLDVLNAVSATSNFFSVEWFVDLWSQRSSGYSVFKDTCYEPCDNIASFYDKYVAESKMLEDRLAT